MPIVKVRVPRTSQPQDACGIGWNKPITRGLEVTAGALGGHNLKPGQANLKKTTDKGVVAAYDNSGDQYAVQLVKPVVLGANFTMFTLASATSVSNLAPPIIALRDGPNSAALLFKIFGTNYFGCDVRSGAIDTPSNISFPTTGKQVSCFARYSNGETLDLGCDDYVYSVAKSIGSASYSQIDILSKTQAGDLPNAGSTLLLGLVWTRALSNAELRSLQENPWQVFEDEEITISVGAGPSGAVMLEAIAAAQASATATMLHGVSLAGAALSVSSSSASLAHGVPLAANAASQASSAAAMSHTVPLSATATGQASSSGQITLQISFAANAIAQALATAAVSLGKPLAATAAGQASGAASLATAAGGSAVNLAAAAAGQAAGTATLSLSIALSAAAVAQAGSSAAFAGHAALAAAAIANAQASAALSVGKPLAGAAAGQAASSATLAVTVQLGAAALAQAAAGGALQLSVNLAAAALGQASSSAALPSSVSLMAAGVAVATSSASLRVVSHSAAVAGALAAGRPMQIQSGRPDRVQTSARPGRYR